MVNAKSVQLNVVFVMVPLLASVLLVALAMLLLITNVLSNALKTTTQVQVHAFNVHPIAYFVIQQAASNANPTST